MRKPLIVNINNIIVLYHACEAWATMKEQKHLKLNKSSE